MKRILVATDFSPTSAKAVGLAVELARATGAELTLFHAVDYPTYAYSFEAPVDLLTDLERAATACLAKELARVSAELPGTTSTLRLGRPAEVILAVADEKKTDLIVLGTHGRSGVPRLLLGSVAERVVRLSPVPVLTVRGGETPAASP